MTTNTLFDNWCRSRGNQQTKRNQIVRAIQFWILGNALNEFDILLVGSRGEASPPVTIEPTEGS
jgi:hypothetical protein